MKAIGDHGDSQIDVPTSVVTYHGWMAMQAFTRPLTAGALVFVLLFGSWMTTAYAASSSLPGDTLYGLKLVTERVQVALSSTERQAVLHTEFAQRRLDEVTRLQSQGNSALIPEAMQAFRDQMYEAQEGLQQLKEEGSVETLAIASVIDQKVDSLNESLTSLEGASESTEEVDEAKKIVREVSDSAVNTIVDVHEEEETNASRWALEQSFRNEYAALIARQAFDLGRIAVIEQVLADHKDPASLLGDTHLEALNYEIDAATDSVARAMDLAAAGGYRTAFDILREADDILLQLEAELAQIEFAIMNQEVDAPVDEEVDFDSEGIDDQDAQQVEVHVGEGGEVEVKLKEETIE